MATILSLITKTREGISECLAKSGWTRLSRHWIIEALDPNVGYCAYTRHNSEESLIFSEAGKDGYYLLYCFPIEKTANIDEYNQFIKQIGDDLEKEGIPIEISADNSFPVMEGVSIHTLKALNYFSGNANKDDGHSHSLDNQRWLKFIYSSIYIGEMSLISDNLSNVLSYELGWSEEKSNELAVDYDNAISAISFFMSVEGQRAQL